MKPRARRPVPAYPTKPAILAVQDLRQCARVAVDGARFHFEQLRALATNASGLVTHWEERSDLEAKDRALLQDDVNRFHWHLRGFFWELVAAFDTALQILNRDLALGIAEENVKWETVREKAQQLGKRSSTLDAIEKVWDSAWFSETRAYRNFAHRAFNVIQHEYLPADGTVRLIWLLPARQGQEINFAGYTPQLRGYLDAMHKLIATITAKP